MVVGVEAVEVAAVAAKVGCMGSAAVELSCS
jgi:hypothetical protein